MTGVEGVAAPAVTLEACRTAIQRSNETAKHACELAGNGSWRIGRTSPDGATEIWEDDTFQVSADLWTEQAHHIAANDPATRLALNAALTVVLDGIEATFGQHLQCSDFDEAAAYPCDDYCRALASLAAVAHALGVQP